MQKEGSDGVRVRVLDTLSHYKKWNISTFQSIQEERKKMKLTQIAVIFMIMVLVSSTITRVSDETVAASPSDRSKRVRRMLGSAMSACTSKKAPICKYFVYRKSKKLVCVMITVKKCHGLD